MWARAGREIAAAYARHGSPLRTLGSMPPTPVLQVYAQPPDQGYLVAQEEFARHHRWFTVRRLTASGHSPMLEVPEAAAASVQAFLDADGGPRSWRRTTPTCQ